MKVALVAPDDFSFWIFRKGLISALIEAGCEIATFSVEGTSLSVDTAEQLETARQLARQDQTVYKSEIS